MSMHDLISGHGFPLVEAIRSLRNLGRRTIFSLVGIMIGCASVIALLNIGHSTAKEVRAIFEEMGTDTFVIRLYWAEQQWGFPLSNHLFSPSEGVEVAVNAETSGTIRFRGQEANAKVVGTTPALASILRMTLSEGRFLSDFDRHEPHAVMGHRVAETLASSGLAPRVGQRISIGSHSFLIIGILSPQSDPGFNSIQVNDSLFIPVEGMRRAVSAPKIDQLIIRVAEDKTLSTTADTLLQQIENIPGVDSADLQIPQQIIDGMQRQSRSFDYLLLGLAGVSQLGGGVGIMNIMIMSVAQRRREIGVRMAIGAHPRDIRNLFLLEALVLTVIGALGGAVAGTGIAGVYTFIAGSPLSLSALSYFLGIGSTLIVGLFFGLYPAIQASRMQPVEALRDD